MKLIVGNQKTTLNRDAVLKFVEEVNLNGHDDVVICPSYPYIEIYNSKSKFVVGAQNVSEKGNGATTGEVSAEQLNSFNVKYCIVGHSERRKDQKENGVMLYNKIVNLLEFNIKPIFCVGEVLEEKENGVTKDVIGKQILEVFDKLDVNKLNDIIIAYEPVWAIGTGLTPTNDEIEDTTHYIKDLVSDKYNVNISVLYGGSVSKKNVDELNQMDIVDGYLIGGASTKADEFNYIIENNV